YQLAPTQIGDFLIPGFQLDSGGQQLRTQPIQIKVVKPGDAVVPPGATAPTAFVKLVTPKPELYVGEVSEIEVQLYWQDGRPTQYPQLPTDPGFTVGKWLKPAESRVNISNQLYNVVTFKQPITPVKAGALSLGPAVVPLAVPDRTRRPDFFGNRPEREVRLTAEKVMIQVLPLPEQNVPATFAGAVGNFSLAFSAAPTNLAAGDPITVRVKISGRGALDAIRLPPQPEWEEFKTYPPTSQIEGADADNISGTKSFEQVVVPERGGIKALPAFAFSFFDPEQKTFRTLTSAAIPLNVGAASGGASAMPSLPGASNAAPAQPAFDLAHIKPYLGPAATGPLLITRPWFLGLQALPFAAWAALFAWRKHRERLENDPWLQRRNEVAQTIQRGLNELREHVAAGNSEAFFATVSRLLQEQIGERLNVPPNAITEAVVEEGLRPTGASEELRAALHKLFQTANVARYAPSKSSEELSALVPELEQALRALQQWEPSRK
ncbi:MAG TPA: BatD family protein, partial [Candidatus Limnocylindria bacterium]|nr:BatD family protein [Candidatus Limnocylindria bacterium]